MTRLIEDVTEQRRLEEQTLVPDKERPLRWSKFEPKTCYREENRGGGPWPDVLDGRSVGSFVATAKLVEPNLKECRRMVKKQKACRLG